MISRVLDNLLTNLIQHLFSIAGYPTVRLKDGHRMRVYPKGVDSIISPLLLKDKVWEPFETELFRSTIAPGMTVLDVGANLGYYSLIAARAVGDAGRVFAFEPDPDNFQLLCKNIEINGYNNIVPIQKAVTDSSGVVELFQSPKNRGDHRIFNGQIFNYDNDRQKIIVDAISLDEFFDEEMHQPDVIKIDVQGAEMKLFQGSTRMIADRDNLVLFTEVWPKGLSEAGSSAEEYIQALFDNGFELFSLGSTVYSDAPEAILPVNKKTVLQLCATCSKSNGMNLLCRKTQVK